MNIEALFEQLLDEGYKIGAAFDTLIDDNEFTAEEIKSLIEGLLIPTAMAAFSLKFTAMDESFSETNVQQIFEVFLRTEHLSEYENILALAINSETQKAYDAGINEEDSEDGGVINGPFEKLSDDERIAAVKAFLKKIYSSGDDAKNIRPFIKNLPTNTDYLGNNFGSKVQVRSKRYGPAENLDESISRKHFREIAATVAQIKDPKNLARSLRCTCGSICQDESEI